MTTDLPDGGGTRRTLRRAAAGTATLLGLLVVLGVPPAQAAGCSGTTGVTVVVDFGPLGGGTEQVCVASGDGDSAAQVTTDGGFRVERTNDGQPFVCRVGGKPTPEQEPCDDTPPSNAYWGLFWSDGTSGWNYSTRGAWSLEAEDGWSIGWRFQDGGDLEQPSAAPRRGTSPSPRPSPTTSSPRPSSAAPAPARTPRPSASASSAPAASAPASTSASASASRSAAAAPSQRPTRTARPSESPTATEPTDDPTEQETAEAADGSFATVTGGDDPGDDGLGGDTGFAAAAGLAGLSVLAGSAAVVAYRRGRT
jgi:hypothetical protein